MTRISIRMDGALRSEADRVLQELGLNMSVAVNLFVRQVVRQQGMPCTPTLGNCQTQSAGHRQRSEEFLDYATKSNVLPAEFLVDRDATHEH